MPTPRGAGHATFAPCAFMALFLLGVGCSGSGRPEEQASAVPVAKEATLQGSPAAAPDASPASRAVTADAPCSGYPLTGDVGPFRLAPGSDIEPPKRIRFQEPDLRRLGLELSDAWGLLLLELVVSDRGSVESVVAVTSVNPDFDREAVEALKAARFEPARRRGEPVAVCMTYSVWPHE